MRNRIVLGQPNPVPVTVEQTGTICILACDGRLFGPFDSRMKALFWCSCQDIDTFSTYDLLPPTVEPKNG